MFNVCPSCGIYSVDKEIRPADDWQAQAVCLHCGYAHPFLRLPLFMVTGASGAGKTALPLYISSRDANFVHLESDILWRAEFNSPKDNYREYRETWLRLAKNISQTGRPVILYGSVTPDQLELCQERRYFQQVYYLALVCEPEILAMRLRARPDWRGSGSDEFVNDMLEFNRWFHEQSLSNGISLLDTSRASIPETAEALLAWAARIWPGAAIL